MSLAADLVDAGAELAAIQRATALSASSSDGSGVSSLRPVVWALRAGRLYVENPVIIIGLALVCVTIMIMGLAFVAKEAVG